MKHSQTQGFRDRILADVTSRAAAEYSHDNGELALLRILLKLRHLDLTGRISNKDAAMEAHGGYRDVFVGYISSECLRHRRTICTKEGEVKVAIKRLRVRLKKDIKFAKTLAREMGIWSRLDHPNILPLLGYMFEKDYPSFISEWIEYGTVRDFLRRNPEYDITDLALGIAEGLEYIHSKDIVHSDMKSDNVLIGKDLQPLICDFGISRMLDSSQSCFVSTTHDHSVKGSTRWMAVELLALDEVKHSKETDVWAYGMTLYEMVSKELPYAHLRNDAQVMSALVKGELPRLPTSPDGKCLSSDSYSTIRSICEGCWAKVPRERLTMARITLLLSSLLIHALEQCLATTQSGGKRNNPNIPLEPQMAQVSRRQSNAVHPASVRMNQQPYPLNCAQKQPPQVEPMNFDPDSSFRGDSSHRRRPLSPLLSSSTAFQSLNDGGSRQSRPSYVPWNVSGQKSAQSTRPLRRSGTLVGHSRNLSSSRVGEGPGVESSNEDTTQSILRSPRHIYSSSAPENATNRDVRNYDPSSEHSSFRGSDSSPSHDPARSTSTTSTPGDRLRSKARVLPPLLTPPTSPFRKRSSNDALSISLIANNSSRSSLVSVGSSYHSTDDDEARLIYAPDKTEPAWHDVPASVGRSRSRSHGLSAGEPEHIFRQYTGLTRADIIAIQSKLVKAAEARARNSEVRVPYRRRRRRQPSTAQVVHLTGRQQSRTTSPARTYDLRWSTDAPL